MSDQILVLIYQNEIVMSSNSESDLLYFKRKLPGSIISSERVLPRGSLHKALKKASNSIVLETIRRIPSETLCKICGSYMYREQHVLKFQNAESVTDWCYRCRSCHREVRYEKAGKQDE